VQNGRTNSRIDQVNFEINYASLFATLMLDRKKDFFQSKTLTIYRTLNISEENNNKKNRKILKSKIYNPLPF